MKEGSASLLLFAERSEASPSRVRDYIVKGGRGGVKMVRDYIVKGGGRVGLGGWLGFGVPVMSLPARSW